MLIRLLQLIDGAGGTLPLSALAQELGADQALVESMIGDLVRLGYLAPVTPGCAGGSCRHCPQRSACAIPSQARLWALTERGRQMVRQTAAPHFKAAPMPPEPGP